MKINSGICFLDIYDRVAEDQSLLRSAIFSSIHKNHVNIYSITFILLKAIVSLSENWGKEKQLFYKNILILEKEENAEWYECSWIYKKLSLIRWNKII